MNTLIQWDAVDERFYEHGLCRGVLYLPDADPIPWNGITRFDEGSSGMATVMYRDGEIYLADVDASDFSGQLSALFYPDELHECLGVPEATTGLYVDNQKPKRFSFAYQTLIGSGSAGDEFRFQIHLVYNAMAAISPRTRQTNGTEVRPVEFQFDIVCTPVALPGYRPTAHYIIDTTNMEQEKIDAVQALLYGAGTGFDVIEEPISDPFLGGAVVGHLPTPSELLAIMS